MADTLLPWTKEQRALKKHKIDKESARVAARLGAKAVALIVFFDAGDGEHFHILDGGKFLGDPKALYRMMAQTIESLEVSEGEDISFQ